MVGAGVLGGGTPAFSAAHDGLRLVDVLRSGRSENVLLKYQVSPARRSQARGLRRR
jgi:hypothetical protein